MKLKIGIVCYPTFGGSGIVATELGKALAKKGHEIHFISYGRPVRLSHFCSNIFFHEVPILNYPLFDYLPYESALTNKIVDVVQNHNLDILHVHYAVPHAIVAFIAKKILSTKNYPIATITTLHGTDITFVGKDRSYLDSLNFALNESDFVTTVSYNLREEIYKISLIKEDVSVIHNFIDNNIFKESLNDDLHKQFAPNNEKILTHISNFRPLKRILDVLQIFKKVRETIHCKLLMVGDGPDRPLAEEYCRTHHLENNVFFLGKFENIEEILSISDIFLLTSEYESFGLVNLEAMAAGVPCISTNVGGIPEVVIDNQTGFLCNVGDVDTMAQKTIELLTTPDMYLQFKKNAKQQALTFDTINIIKKYEDLYQRAMQKVHHK